MFRGHMKKLLLLCLLPLAARAEIKDRVAAVVNGQPITLSEVRERVQPELNRTTPGPAGEAQRKGFLHEAMEQIIDERLVESEAQNLGIEVSEDDIQRGVEQLGRQNGMDLEQFKAALAQQNISLETVRESLRRQQLILRLLQYKVKPRRVTDDEVQAAYAAMNKNAEFEVRARDIFISSPEGAPKAQEDAARTKAETALRRLRGGETFAKVARELSDGPTAQEGGDLGWFRRGMLIKAIEEPAFSLKPGEMSGITRVGGEHGGYHIVQLEERRPIAARPLPEVQEEIRNRLSNESVMKEREHYLAQLRKTATIDEKL
jgi:peptidyl-prolyl cis-trans isomerase SurA